MGYICVCIQAHARTHTQNMCTSYSLKHQMDKHSGHNFISALSFKNYRGFHDKRLMKIININCKVQIVSMMQGERVSKKGEKKVLA